MKSYCVQILVVMSVLIILGGCGGSNGSQNLAVGSTVSMSSAITSGANMTAITSASNLLSLAGLNFTLTSALLNTVSGTFTGSTISVPSYSVSYTYIGNANPYDTNTYPIPGFSYDLGGTIPAGGTLAINGVPTMMPAVKTYLLDHYSSAINCSPTYRANNHFTNYTTNIFQYRAAVKFNGVEDTTSKSLYSTTTVTVFVTR